VMKIRVYHSGGKREYCGPTMMTLKGILKADSRYCFGADESYRCFKVRYMPAAINTGATVKRMILSVKL